MNTRSRTSSGNDNIGSKVIVWDDGGSRMTQVEADSDQSRTQGTIANQIPYSYPQTRSLIPESDGDIGCADTGQESRSLPQPQHRVVPQFLVAQGNTNSPYVRQGSSFGVEHIEQCYNTDQAPQCRAGAANVHPELSNSEIVKEAVTSPLFQHGSNSNQDTIETGDMDQLDNVTQPHMRVGDEAGSICSQFSTLTVHTQGSSLLATNSSGYHSPQMSEPSDSSSYCRPGRSAAGQASGHGEAVSSFGQYGQQYSPSDTDSLSSIPSHCRMDSLGPPLEESRKKKHKTSEKRRSGTSSGNTDQMTNSRADRRAVMERPSSSSTTQGHVRSSRGDREATTTSTHKQRKKLKKYPAEVDDNKRKKMEAIMSMFTDRVDPRLLQLHLRGCLQDHQCEHILKLSDVKPRPYVNQTLWKYLKRAPYWWQNLERALEKCEYNELLDKLREEQECGI